MKYDKTDAVYIQLVAELGLWNTKKLTQST